MGSRCRCLFYFVFFLWVFLCLTMVTMGLPFLNLSTEREVILNLLIFFSLFPVFVLDNAQVCLCNFLLENYRGQIFQDNDIIMVVGRWRDGLCHRNCTKSA